MGTALIARFGLTAGLAQASPVVRLLVLTQLAFNVGFFMVVPYLSVYLSRDLGQATAIVGAVLGLRTVSQQGLFFVGGAVADRIGTKPTVLTGCTVRVAGLLLLGLSPSLVGVFAGAVLTGFAGALFSPAVEAALARSAASSGESSTSARLDAFALFNAFGQIGAFAGPLIGAALLWADFAVLAVTGAVVFVVIGLAHLRWLPSDSPTHAGQPAMEGLSEVVRNGAFLGFAATMGMQLVAYNQLYLLVPLELEQGWGDQAPLGVLLAVASLTVVLGQLRVTRWVGRLPTRTALSLGLGITCLGLVAAGIGAGIGGPIPVISGTAGFVVLLAFGQMITSPTARAAIPGLAGDRHLGSYYGTYASVGGLLVLPFASLIGLLMDTVGDGPAGRIAPWLTLAVVTAVAAVIMKTGLLQRQPA
ncbi:MFS transporter [Gordonia terrae]|uniref:MFS transporter n=1 Tax=Gordonia terrae TaxID=2055 RepID=UPI003F6D533A